MQEEEEWSKKERWGEAGEEKLGVGWREEEEEGRKRFKAEAQSRC